MAGTPASGSGEWKPDHGPLANFAATVPTMFAATGYKLLKTGFHFTGEQWAVLALGSAISFAVAYAVIAAFMNYIRARSFEPFGYYRIALGAVVLCAAWMGWIGA